MTNWSGWCVLSKCEICLLLRVMLLVKCECIHSNHLHSNNLLDSDRVSGRVRGGCGNKALQESNKAAGTLSSGGSWNPPHPPHPPNPPGFWPGLLLILLTLNCILYYGGRVDYTYFLISQKLFSPQCWNQVLRTSNHEFDYYMCSNLVYNKGNNFL